MPLKCSKCKTEMPDGSRPGYCKVWRVEYNLWYCYDRIGKPRAKNCPVCNVTKPLEAFHVDNFRRLGRLSRCSECERARQIEYNRKRGMAPRISRSTEMAKLQAKLTDTAKCYRIRSGREAEEKITAEKFFARFGHRCATLGCGGNFEHLDHVIPIAAGGRHTMFNVQPLCELCHVIKTTDDIACIRLSKVDLLTSLSRG